MANSVRNSALGGVPHGFFGHDGGRQQFGYGGGDDVDSITGSRQSACEAILQGATLAAPHQVHSPDVLTVESGWKDAPTGRPEGDGLVTATPGVALGIVTADCAPVLFVDETAGVIGAAHAGWRGAKTGVLENTIEAMEQLGAQRDRIAAAIGPTIAQASYEVDDAFKIAFGQSSASFFAAGKPGHWQFDLPAYVCDRLTQSGVGQVDDLGLDTYTLENDYYSFRRATHRGKSNYGRQISLIALAKN
ncbi:MAG: peptidoglycan editing factor PgeF [Erythrobacter sp.]